MVDSIVIQKVADLVLHPFDKISYFLVESNQVADAAAVQDSGVGAGVFPARQQEADAFPVLSAIVTAETVDQAVTAKLLLMFYLDQSNSVVTVSFYPAVILTGEKLFAPESKSHDSIELLAY